MIFFKFYARVAIRVALPLFDIELFRETNWLCRRIESDWRLIFRQFDEYYRVYCRGRENRKERYTSAFR